MPKDLENADYQRLLDLRTGLRRFLHWSDEQAGEAGLTGSQHQLLLAIRGHAHPRGPTVGDLAGYLLLRHHSAVGLVDRAEKAGLVERREDTGDRRGVRLRLTALGARPLQQPTPPHLQGIQRPAPRIPEPPPGPEPEEARGDGR